MPDIERKITNVAHTTKAASTREVFFSILDLQHAYTLNLLNKPTWEQCPVSLNEK